MTIEELEELMINRGLVIRAIPKEITHIYEVHYAKRYPNGTVKYMEEYKREMLLVTEVPENAGKFVMNAKSNTETTVKFHPPFFSSIKELVEYVEQSI